MVWKRGAWLLCHFGDSKIRHNNPFPALLFVQFDVISSNSIFPSDFHQWQSSGLQLWASLSWPVRHQPTETLDPWSARSVSYSAWRSSGDLIFKPCQAEGIKSSEEDSEAWWEGKGNSRAWKGEGECSSLTPGTNLSLLTRVRSQQNWSNKNAYRGNVFFSKDISNNGIKDNKGTMVTLVHDVCNLEFLLFRVLPSSIPKLKQCIS